ncbi:MAG TPA: hypothetical protein VGS22_09335 [Thermoanaerobaculia bacterium]|jgi:hypothetical protein|nr:hypothetical protein [Thermoanaerobaculia bacterium]
MKKENLATALSLVLGILCAATPVLAAGWDASCGDQGKAPCAWNAAKFESKQNGLCPSGQFFDLIDGGTCWSCPNGLARTVFAVNTDKACEKVATTDFKRVEERGKGRGWFGTDCDSGQFWDIVDGNCHSCPGGYAMQVIEHVHGDRKCAKGIPGKFAKAQKAGPPCGTGKLWDPRNGGECWSCPNDFNRTVAPVDSTYACEYKLIGGGTGLIGCKAGLSSIRGKCLKTGECGKANQRPCEVGERIPSCDAGMKEDFKQNLCVPLKAGETPFTGGLSSLSGYLGATLQAHCKELIGGIQINFQGDFGVGARCGRDVAAGFACAIARDVAAGYTDMANSLLETAPAVPKLADQMNNAANVSPCKDLGERFAKATKHGKATGTFVKTDCPAGQFWDPDGNCYSCPKDYTRTLFPVTHDRACTDKVGGNLAKFGCGAFKGVEKNFDGPLDCTVEVLRDGSLFQEPLDPKKANQFVCMATGELGYYIVRSGVEIGKAAVTGDISGILTSIGKVKSSVSNALVVKRLVDCKNKK